MIGAQLIKKTLGGFVAAGALLAGVGIAVPAASALQPSPTTLYSMQASDRCNKGGNDSGCIVYPKSAQLPSGRIVMTFERSIGDPVGQTEWVYASDDNGMKWDKISEIKAPAYLSDDPKYDKYTSNWTNPYLYVLPKDVGSLKAGTLLLASVVSGDDVYYREQKAAQGDNWYNGGDGDRRDLAIALYSSVDEGQSWKIENIITEGGWQGGSARAGGKVISSENKKKQVDPVWEPYLMVYNDQLVCYYSDENEYSGVNADGTLIEAADNDTKAESNGSGQVLAHRTWNGKASSTWSAAVADETGTNMGGGRAGMITTVPTTDGKWIATYEWWGGGDNVQYKIADSPLEFRNVKQQGIKRLGNLSTGGSPVLMRMSNGAIVYNASGSGDVWVNYSGRSDGQWTQLRTNVGGGYSRNLMQIADTGRVLLFQTGFSGSDIKHADVDLGHSKGDYFQLVNKATGQALGTSGKIADADFTGDTPDVRQEAFDAKAETQWWHLMDMDDAKGGVAILNKAGGRSVARWGNQDKVGTQLAQWADNAGANRWTIVDAGDGYVRLQVQGKEGLYIGGDKDTVQTVSDKNDDTTLWKLISDANRAALQTAVDKASALVEHDYTAESWSALAVALAEGKGILADQSARQSTVDTTAKKLNDAVVALVKVESEKPTTPSTSEEGASGDKTDGNPTQNSQPNDVDIEQPKSEANNDADASLSRTGAAVTAVAVFSVVLAALGSTILVVRRRS